MNSTIELLKISMDSLELAVKALGKISERLDPMKYKWRVDRDDSRRWDYIRFYCGRCGNWQTYGKTRFCPNCGADMEVDDD